MKKLKNLFWEVVLLKYLIFICLIFVLSGWQVYAESTDVDSLKILNSKLIELEYPQTVGNFVFHVQAQNEEVKVVQVIYNYNKGWYPWFDQEEGRPRHVMVDGRLYSQQIYLAVPEELANRSIRSYRKAFNTLDSEEFGDSVPLNFYELKSINPSLEHYDRVEPPITEDGSIVLYSPPGPGIAFVTDKGGDIYAMLRISKEINTWFPMEREKTVHPELGELYYSTLFFKDSEGKFNIDDWFSGFKLESVKAEISDFIEPGFILKSVEFEENDFMGVIQIGGEMLNETDNNYQIAFFTIHFFGQDGNKIDEGMLQIQDFRAGQEGEITGMFMPETKVNIDDLVYKIEFSHGF